MKTAKWLTIALSTGIIFAATVTYAAKYAPVVFTEPEEEKQVQVIYDGVTIDGVEVGGMTLDKAENAVRVADSAMLSRSVAFTLKEKTVSTTWRSFGIKFDETGVFEKAMAIGKSDGSMVGRFKALADIKAEGTALETVISGDADTIHKFLSTSLSGLDGSPIDAQLVHEDNTFTIIPSVDGIAVDADKTSETVMALINERKFDTKTIQADGMNTRAHITEEDLAYITDVLGYCRTDVTGTDDRATNVKVGAANINGTVLLPGESASVNELLKPRLPENGYKLAPQYKDGAQEDVYGGGICQVSSTLYNALLEAEIQIDERNPHSMKISYLDPSRDAAISAGFKDLKFTNNLDYPIYIEGSSVNRVCKFTVYGKETRPENRKVVYESVVTYMEQHPDIIVEVPTEYVTYSEFVGDSRHPETKSYLLKIVYIDGVEVERTKLHSDYYMGSVKTNYVGTMPLPEEPQGDFPFDWGF